MIITQTEGRLEFELDVTIIEYRPGTTSASGPNPTEIDYEITGAYIVTGSGRAAITDPALSALLVAIDSPELGEAILDEVDSFSVDVTA